MEKRKPIPAPFEKGVNFTNWLEYRPAEEIDADLFTEQDFVNARKLGCDVVRLPIHFEKICKEAAEFCNGTYTHKETEVEIINKE